MWKWLKCLFLGHEYVFAQETYIPPMGVKGFADEGVFTRLASGSTHILQVCPKCGKEKITIRDGDWRLK